MNVNLHIGRVRCRNWVVLYHGPLYGVVCVVGGVGIFVYLWFRPEALDDARERSTAWYPVGVPLDPWNVGTA